MFRTIPLFRLTVKLVLVFVALSHGYGASLPKTSARHTAGEVLLVYNADSPISTAIAKDYAGKRGVTKALAIHCADSAVSDTNETISLADYEREIAAPVREFLSRHQEINFLVLTKGMPIRIDGGETGSRDEQTTGNLHPSVDSYLAAMDYRLIQGAVKIRIHGSGADGFGWLNQYWNQDVPFSHAAFGGYLVTRLDGYTLSDAEALVTRSLAAETETMADVQGARVLLMCSPFSSSILRMWLPSLCL